MDGDRGSGLSDEERQAIALHARRRAAYLALGRLVGQWDRELQRQAKADRIAARALGVVAVLAALAAIAGFVTV